MKVANDILSLEVDSARRLILTDLRCGATWQSLAPLAHLRIGGTDDKPGKRLPGCTLDLTALENGLHGHLRCPRAEGPEISVGFDLLLEGEVLRVAVHPAQGLQPGEVVELACPRGLGWQPTGGQGYLVLPLGIGSLCDFSPKRKRQQIEWLKDGSMIFRVTVDGLTEISWWILGYGAEVGVIAPALLRKRIAKTAERMINMYKRKPK